ncbi:MAG: SCO family protein [Gaiellaceae bacterium]
MRRVFPLAALLLVAAGCGSSRPALVEAPTQDASRFAGTELVPPHRADALSLRDAAGRHYTLSARKGRYVLVTFLYTHCPDVCPLIASNLNTVLRTSGPRGNVDVLAVSVDPKRDTPAAVRAYARRMHLQPRFHYLIGTRRELQRVWAAWHVTAQDKAAGVVNHIVYTALVDPRGRERLIYDAQVTAQQVLHDLRVLKSRR